MKVKCYVCQKDMNDTEAAKSFYDINSRRHYLCKDCAASAKAHETPIPQADENAQETDASNETSSIGWVSLLRAVAAIAIVVGIIASIAAGITIGEESAVLGFLVAAGGSLFTLILNAAVMIFLDMADDIRAIRHKLDRM